MRSSILIEIENARLSTLLFEKSKENPVVALADIASDNMAQVFNEVLNKIGKEPTGHIKEALKSLNVEMESTGCLVGQLKIYGLAGGCIWARNPHEEASVSLFDRFTNICRNFADRFREANEKFVEKVQNAKEPKDVTRAAGEFMKEHKENLKDCAKEVKEKVENAVEHMFDA